MAKIRPENHLAREFLAAFPRQRQFGGAAAAGHIRRLMEEGIPAEILLQRVLAWSRVREDLRPWELAKEPPAQPIRKCEPAPQKKALPLGSVPIPDGIRRRVRAILEPIPYEIEDL